MPDRPAGGGTKSETGPAGESAPAVGALDLDQIQRIWPAVLQKLAEKEPVLAASFEGARPVSYGEEGLQVGFPAASNFHKTKAESPERRDAVADAFEGVSGQRIRPTYVLLEGEAPPDTPAPGSEEIDEEQLLERLKSEFDAEEVG